VISLRFAQTEAHADAYELLSALGYRVFTDADGNVFDLE
jgi:hypothetical protein